MPAMSSITSFIQILSRNRTGTQMIGQGEINFDLLLRLTIK
jgi:hypothetical protein